MIVLALLGEFIAKGLIKEAGKDRLQLTPRGKVKADKIMGRLSHKERALVLLLADHIIREGLDRWYD